MAENYKLVSEDEWQAMVDRAEVAEGWSKHWKERAESAESLSTYWKEEARSAERKIATFLDAKADREEPVKIPGSDNPTRPRNGEKNWLWRYDVDGNLIWSGPPELAPAFGESETDTRDNAERMIQEPSRPWTYSVPVGFTELVDGGPQRPHESLVWAILFAQQVPGASSVKREILMENAINNADKLLDTWRARWPESTD